MSPLFSRNRNFRFPLLLVIGLFFSLLTIAQVNLKCRLLSGYGLNSDAPVNKGKPTLFITEQVESFTQTFQPAPAGTPTATNRKPDLPNFDKEMAIGIALPSTRTPAKLSVSRVFVQDSILTVRYIRMADTTLTKSPLAVAVHPTLVFTIPKQTVLKTKLVENGKVVLTQKTYVAD